MRPVSTRLSAALRDAFNPAPTPPWLPVCALMLTLQSSAMAQQASEVDKVQEIVVTAEKRGSTVQKTAISMTAISGDDLQEKGLSNVAELAREVPGVAVKASGPGQAEFTIRGMASPAGVAPTVGFYLDEIPVTPPTIATAGKVGIDPDLYDLARVEVLRGPQGTLYGASSMGGTIKLVPAAPDLKKFSGSVQGVVSTTEGGGTNGTLNAMLNIPLSMNIAALRLVLTDKHQSGWLDRIVAAPFPLPDTSASDGVYFTAPRGDVAAAPVRKVYRQVNNEDLQGLRASLLVKPDANLSITPSVFYQRIRQDGPDTYDNPPGGLAHYQPFDIAEPFRDTFAVFGLKINYEFEAATLTSSSAYTKRDRRQVQDSSETMQKLFGDFGVTAYAAEDGGIGPVTTTESQPTRQFSQELRLASNGEGPLRWIVGAFYSRFRSTYQATSLAPEGAPVLGTDNIYTASLGDTLVQSALFGNLSYDLTPELRATAGLRYFHSKDKSTNIDSGLFSSGLGDPPPASAEGFNPMLNLAYTASKDSMVYATAAKGFRDGAAQHGVPESCAADLAALGLTAAPARFGPDTVWSYEVGSKNRFLDRSLTVNGAIYYQQWSKVQQTVLLPTCGFTYTANAADAAVSGLELEVAARTKIGLSMEFGVGYAHARFKNDDAATGTHAGDKLLNVPEWTGSASLRYEQPINDELSFVGRVGAVYVGATDAVTDQRKTLPGYTLAGLRAGVQSETWTATLFVDNLANRKVALNNVASLSVNVPSLDRVSMNRPRMIGIDVAWPF